MASTGVAMPTSDGAVMDVGANAHVVLRGYTIRESAGATALLYIRENSPTGKILAVIQLAANECRDVQFEPGRLCSGDLFFDKSSGTYEGTVFFD